MMRLIKSRPWTSLSIIVMVLLVGVNAFFVFKDNSKVARSYFINEFQRATAGDRQETIKKDTIVVPAETYTISADAKSLAAVNVKRGQAIQATDLLATYKSEEIDDELTKLEAERDAYETELSDLESALSQIESTYGDMRPESSINTDQISDKLNVTVQLELGQQHSPSTAIAILNRHIAEVTRQIAIMDAHIAQIQARQGVISPIDGIISNVITDEAGTVTFEIYSTEKAMLAYLSTDEWQKVHSGQTVHFNLPHVKHSLSGEVLVKQMIATNNDSTWQNQLKNTVTLPEPTNYEVTLQQDDMLENTPFSTIGHASIVVNEAADAYKVPSSWVKSSKGTKSVYIIDNNGKIRYEDIDVAFSIADSTIFTGYMEEGTPILTNEKRNILARSFCSMPIQKMEWQHFKEIGWKKYIKYIIF